MRRFLRLVTIAPVFSVIVFEQTVAMTVGFQTSTGTSASKQAPAPTPVKIAELPKAVREEIERLISDDAGKRATAAASLGEMGPAAAPAIPFLAAALDDSRTVLSLRKGSVSVKSVVLDTLRLFGEPARNEILKRLTPPQNAQHGAIWAVKELREVTAVPQLTTILFDPGAKHRTMALDALVTIQGPKFDMATLLPLIDPARVQKNESLVRPVIDYFENESLVRPVIEYFEKAKDRRAVPALLALIPASDFFLSNRLIEVLGNIGDPAAVEPLIQLLRDKKHVLGVIAKSLEQLKDSRAIGPLIAALPAYGDYQGNRVANHRAVLSALQKLTGTGEGFSDSQWLDWWKKKGGGIPR